MLLRVLGPAPGVCLALGPVFPEVAHRGPSLMWSGGGISRKGAPYILCPLFCPWFCPLCVFMCVCESVCVYLCYHSLRNVTLKVQLGISVAR